MTESAPLVVQRYTRAIVTEVLHRNKKTATLWKSTKGRLARLPHVGAADQIVLKVAHVKRMLSFLVSRRKLMPPS